MKLNRPIRMDMITLLTNQKADLTDDLMRDCLSSFKREV